MPAYTPMMMHYLEIKKNYPDALVFYRLGDFYEMFFDDAKTASRELDLVLTGRNAGAEERVPMCGVPHHAVTSYVQRLLARGYKVAIVEQMEDPAEAVGLVRRDVIRVITPGTAIDEITDEKSSVFLGSLCDYGYGYAVAACEITTGETKLFDLPREITLLRQCLLSNNIRELVVRSDYNRTRLESLQNLGFLTVSSEDEQNLKKEELNLLNGDEDVHHLEAIGRLLRYLEHTQKREISHLLPFEPENDKKYLKMDYSTLLNLELVEFNRQNSKEITLWSFLDRCESAAGSRLLKKWVQKPLVSVDEINQRLDMIAYLKKKFLKSQELREALSGLYDLERLIARIGYGNANGRDVLRLEKTLAQVPTIRKLVRESGVYPEYDDIDICEDLYAAIKGSIVDEPPVTIHSGGIFRDGYNAKLDELRKLQRESRDWIVRLEQREREKTGIKTLKVGYNKVFGYYIEISKGAVASVKEEWGYERKQTLTTGERFITSELKEQEDAILHAEEKAVRLESRLFAEMMENIRQYLSKLQILANYLAVIDANYALSVVSSANNYVRPTFNDEGTVDVRQGRHPILETMNNIHYVPNDIRMTNDRPIQIITGPNMGGKSTYMRQCALIFIMAQMGCYVPARKADLPVFDQIFTRIGSTDDILSGQSTFMVEMTEANNALMNATDRSLIIFDEIGRGTSTYDGMALAQAMLEYISATIGAKTLFSTHYHELTSLENNMDTVINKHVDVHEENDTVTFLYKVKDGKANKSYGIHVASLARLPESVIDRSRDLLKGFETSRQHRNDQTQIVMVEKTDRVMESVRDTLSKTDPDNMTPIEALQLVAKLKEKINDK